MTGLFLWSNITLLLSWGYFGRYRLHRPPIGVLNHWDVGFMLVGIVLMPYLYLLLPTPLIGALLGLATLSLVFFCLEPIGRGGWQSRGAVLLLGLGNGVAFYCFNADSLVFQTMHNLVQLIAVVGVTNLWAQSGMKARDAALIGGVLVVYDYLFTAVLPLMDNLFTHVGRLPFAPLLAWQNVSGQPVSIGLGDLLLAAVFPLTMRKAYGPAAGYLALGLAVAVLAGVMGLATVGVIYGSFPLMVVLGPLLVAQYGFWRWWRGRERTTFQYWRALGS